MAKILVIDDREPNRAFLTTLLGYEKHRLLEACDGVEGLDLAVAECPDLVIADIVMPTMDGYEFVQRLRSEPRIADTPVIFCTAHHLGREAERLAESCGVRHILTKPAEPAEVLRIVRAALDSSRERVAPPQEQDFARVHTQVLTQKLSETAEELVLSNSKLKALTQLAQELASEHDPGHLLERVCRHARELVGARYAVIAVRERERAVTRHVFASGIEEDRLELHGGVKATGALAELLVRPRSLSIAPVQRPLAALGLPDGHPPITSLLAASMASLTNVYGWICLSDKLGSDAFSKEDEQLLVTLAALAGRVYENGRLYGEVKARAKELELEVAERLDSERALARRMESERLIARLSTSLSKLAPERAEEGIERVLEEVGAHLGVDRVVVYLVGPDGQEVVGSYRWQRPGCSLIGGEPENLGLAAGRWYREQLEREQIVVVHSLSDLPDHAVPEWEMPRSRGILSCLAVALAPSGTYRGFITLTTLRAEHYWTEDEQALLRLVAELLGGFLERRRVQEEQARLVATLEATSDIVAVTNVAGETLYLNRAGRELFALDASADVRRVRFFDRKPTWAVDLLIGEALPTAMRDGVWRGEAAVLRHDGREIPVSQVIVAHRSRRGDVEFLSAIMRDITDSKRAEQEVHRLNAELEQRVEQRTAELQAANAELEAFAYSVSHDLRGPLRTINGFAQLLVHDHRERLDPQGQEYLTAVTTGTRRMEELIDALLRLSRVTLTEIEWRQVDLSTLARDVCDEMRRREPDRTVDLVIQPGLVASGDPRLLRVLLQNLLGNAWKYTGRTERPRIEVGALRHDGTSEFFVRDNGAGFEPAYSDKLFVAFQRLHGVDEFEGTGIGLATVARIIRRHGGQVRAEGDVGEGATFYFTLGNPPVDA